MERAERKQGETENEGRYECEEKKAGRKGECAPIHERNSRIYRRRMGAFMLVKRVLNASV